MITTYLRSLAGRVFGPILRAGNTAGFAGLLVGLWGFAWGAGAKGWAIPVGIVAIIWGFGYLFIVQARVNYLAGEVRRYRDEQRLWTEFRNLSYLQTSDDDERTSA